MSNDKTTTPEQQPLSLRERLRARWQNYTGIWEPAALGIGLVVKRIWASIKLGDLSVFSHLDTIRDLAFADFYQQVGHHFAAYEASVSVPALVASAHGRILELGPGTGNQVGRFDARRVERIYGVEPNAAFAGALAARVKDTPALLGKYTAVFAGVEDAARLAEHGIVDGSIDCIVSTQVLCSVRDPPAVARALYGLLRPGGEIIFWEHGRGGDRLTRVVMWLWNFVWPVALGGCRLGCDIRGALESAGPWATIDIHQDKEPYLILPRVWGRLVKPS